MLTDCIVMEDKSAAKSVMAAGRRSWRGYNVHDSRRNLISGNNALKAWRRDRKDFECPGPKSSAVVKNVTVLSLEVLNETGPLKIWWFVRSLTHVIRTSIPYSKRLLCSTDVPGSP